MQTLNPQKTNLLMQIISTHYPNQQILHLSDGCNDLHTTLYELTKSRGFEYDLKCVDIDIDGLDLQRHERLSIEPLDLRAKQYNKHAKLYEYIFVTLESGRLMSDIDTILKKFFRIMKNAGSVVMLIEKGAPLLEEIDKKLEESYFVAINHIDIFDDYDVVTAKKMHGWGAYAVGF